MIKIAIWCRSVEKNIIGIGNSIPWHIPNDFKRFRLITLYKDLLLGQTTYESLPNKTLPCRKLHVLTKEENYEVSDPRHHTAISSLDELPINLKELYVVGGASVYNWLVGDEEIDIVIDCVYHGELRDDLEGEIVTIDTAVKKIDEGYLLRETIMYPEDKLEIRVLTKNESSSELLKTFDLLVQKLRINDFEKKRG